MSDRASGRRRAGVTARIASASAVAILCSLVWGAGVVVAGETALVGGYATVPWSDELHDCAIMAHSKALNRIIAACSLGKIKIVATDTGKVKTIDAPMVAQQPFIHRPGEDMLLYLPSNGPQPVIREIDFRAATLFDRPVVVEGGFSYANMTLNPRDRCLVVNLYRGSGARRAGVLEVHDYEPRDRTPLKVGAGAAIEMDDGPDVMGMGSPNHARAVCVRNAAGELSLFTNAFEGEPGKGEWVMRRTTARGNGVVLRSATRMKFFQPKLAPYIFARDDITRGLLQIDTDTAEVRRIGEKVDGGWEDFDPSTRIGLVATPVRREPGSTSVGGMGPHRFCLADLEGCLAGGTVLTTAGDLFAPSASNGWLGDGFISAASGWMLSGGQGGDPNPPSRNYWF